MSSVDGRLIDGRWTAPYEAEHGVMWMRSTLQRALFCTWALRHGSFVFPR